MPQHASNDRGPAPAFSFWPNLAVQVMTEATLAHTIWPCLALQAMDPGEHVFYNRMFNFIWPCLTLQKNDPGPSPACALWPNLTVQVITEGNISLCKQWLSTQSCSVTRRLTKCCLLAMNVINDWGAGTGKSHFMAVVRWQEVGFPQFSFQTYLPSISCFFSYTCYGDWPGCTNRADRVVFVDSIRYQYINRSKQINVHVIRYHGCTPNSLAWQSETKKNEQ